MKYSRLIFLLVTFQLIGCDDKSKNLEIRLGETLMQNQGLKDSIETLNSKLKDYKLVYSFNYIKPTLIPKDTFFEVGEESTFILVNDARNLKRNHKPYTLEYDLNSTLQSEMSWKQEDQKWDHTLHYTPQKSGRDTITIWFHYQDPDSTQSIRLPAEYIVDIK